MKVIHLIGGGDEGGAKSHVLQLVKELGKHIDITLVSFRKAHFHDDAVKMGIDARVIHSGNVFMDVRRTLKLVREGGYNLIHAHGAKANMIGTIIKRITGIPIVTTVHSDYRLDYMHSLVKRLSFGLINMASLRRIDYHISVSNNFREMLVNRSFDPQKIYTVYNGINFDQPVPKSSRRDFFNQYGIQFPEDCILIGIMARLHPVKDHETFLKAAAEVYRSNPKARFIIAGPGDELRPQLEQLSQKLGLSGAVFFTGMVNKPYDFFQSIDINVLTSLSESFPYVILEGARLARATVSTRVGGLADLIETGVNGYLVEPRDWKGLAGYLLELSLDESKRTEMGDLLRKKAESQFSLRHMCQTQLEIYRRILETERRIKTSGKTYDLAILGYYGYKNSGDEAILKSILDSLRKLDPELSCIVLSKNPRETIRNYHVDSINRFNLLKIRGVLKKTRLFMAGGGSLIQDNTSTRSIVYYLYMLNLAKKCGSKAMLFANGIGPINKKVNRDFASRILNKLDVITLRDTVSFDEVKKLNVSKPEILVTSDPAILLEPASPKTIADMMKREGIPEGKQLIGLSIRKWADMGYMSEIAAIADFCAQQYDVLPVFMPMQHPSDRIICEAIARRMKHKSIVIKRLYPPECMLAFTGRLELIIGMRLHSLVYAANQCIPMTGLVYEPKVDSFLHEINQPSAGAVQKLNHDHVVAIIKEIWENREEIKKNLEASKEKLVLLAKSNLDTAINLLME